MRAKPWILSPNPINLSVVIIASLWGICSSILLPQVSAVPLVDPLLLGKWQVLPEKNDVFYEITADGQCVRYVHGQAQPGICEFTAAYSRYQLTTPDGAESGTYSPQDAGLMILINPQGQIGWRRVTSSSGEMRQSSAADSHRLGNMGQIP